MHLGSLKTAAGIAEDHGHGLLVVVGGQEWPLSRLIVVDHPKDLAPCHGHAPSGDLLLFNAEQVELVKIEPSPDGRKATVRSVGG